MQFSEERKWQRNEVTNWKLELFEYLRSPPFFSMKRQMLQKAGPPGVKKPLPWQKPNILQWLNALAKAPNYV